MEETLIKFLIEYTTILKKTYELHEVTEAIVKKTAEIFNSEGASLLLFDKQSACLYFESSYFSKYGLLKNISDLAIPLGDSIAGKVALSGKSILINDASSDSRFHSLPGWIADFDIQMILAYPIKKDNEVIGVIEVINCKNRPFCNKDREYLNVIGTLIGVFIEKARFASSKLEVARVERELEIGRELQVGIMPNFPIEMGAHHLYGESLPTSGVGGDFWDVIKFRNGEQLLLLGDVSGHGLRAGLVMFGVRMAMKSLAIPNGNIKAIINILNQVLYSEFGNRGIYTTCLFCWNKGNLLNLLRAAHVNPVLKRNGEYIMLTLPSGHPIGLLPKRKNDSWAKCRLKPGDVLFLYTDGIEDGFPDESIKMDVLFNSIEGLEDKVINKEFFSYLKKHRGWKNIDDATLLMLTLEE